MSLMGRASKAAGFSLNIWRDSDRLRRFLSRRRPHTGALMLRHRLPTLLLSIALLLAAVAQRGDPLATNQAWQPTWRPAESPIRSAVVRIEPSLSGKDDDDPRKPPAEPSNAAEPQPADQKKKFPTPAELIRQMKQEQAAEESRTLV